MYHQKGHFQEETSCKSWFVDGLFGFAVADYKEITSFSSTKQHADILQSVAGEWNVIIIRLKTRGLIGKASIINGQFSGAMLDYWRVCICLCGGI